MVPFNNTLVKAMSRKKDYYTTQKQKTLIKEWKDTIHQCNRSKLLPPQGTKYACDDLAALISDIVPNEDVPIIEMLDIDTFDLAIKYSLESNKILVLNVASDYSVVNGKLVQEELFRRSNAFLTHHNFSFILCCS